MPDTPRREAAARGARSPTCDPGIEGVVAVRPSVGPAPQPLKKERRRQLPPARTLASMASIVAAGTSSRYRAVDGAGAKRVDLLVSYGR